MTVVRRDQVVENTWWKMSGETVFKNIELNQSSFIDLILLKQNLIKERWSFFLLSATCLPYGQLWVIIGEQLHSSDIDQCFRQISTQRSTGVSSLKRICYSRIINFRVPEWMREWKLIIHEKGCTKINVRLISNFSFTNLT